MPEHEARASASCSPSYCRLPGGGRAARLVQAVKVPGQEVLAAGSEHGDSPLGRLEAVVLCHLQVVKAPAQISVHPTPPGNPHSHA